MPSTQPTPLTFGQGVNNRNDARYLEPGYVVGADNVDIDSNGVGKSRDGYALWLTLPGTHSLYRHALMSFALFGDATSLYRLEASGAVTTLATGLIGGDLSYAVIAQRARWSNGVQTGQVDLNGQPAPLGVETPLPSFVVSAVSNGGLFAGRYGVTMTFANAKREEGGAPDTVYVDVAEGGGIQISGVPADDAGVATEARIYVTTANSADLMYAMSVAPGASVALVTAGVRTRMLATQFCEPFPAAAHLLNKAGRLLGAVGRRLVYSPALYPGLNRPTMDSMVVPDEITMLAAPDSQGFLVYVGTKTRTYVLQGDSIDSCALTEACAAGVIPGSMVMVPAEILRMDGVLVPIPLWAGTDGVPYAGTPQGVVPLTDKFCYPIYQQAAAGYVERDGMARYIVSGRGGKQAGLGMGDRLSYEVIQAGP